MHVFICFNMVGSGNRLFLPNIVSMWMTLSGFEGFVIVRSYKLETVRIGCTFCCSEGAHFLLFLNIQQPWNKPAFAFSHDRGQVNIAKKIMKHDTNLDTASNVLRQKNWHKTHISAISIFILLYIILSFLPPRLDRPKFTFFLGRFLGKKKQI